MWEMSWLWNLRSLCKLWEMCLATGAFHSVLFSSFSARWGHFYQLLVEAFECVCKTGADLEGGCRVQGVPPPPPRDDLRFSNTTGILPKKTMWFIGVEVEQETSAPLPKKSPGSAAVKQDCSSRFVHTLRKHFLPFCQRLMRWATIWGTTLTSLLRNVPHFLELYTRSPTNF